MPVQYPSNTSYPSLPSAHTVPSIAPIQTIHIQTQQSPAFAFPQYALPLPKSVESAAAANSNSSSMLSLPMHREPGTSELPHAFRGGGEYSIPSHITLPDAQHLASLDTGVLYPTNQLGQSPAFFHPSHTHLHHLATHSAGVGALPNNRSGSNIFGMGNIICFQAGPSSRLDGTNAHPVDHVVGEQSEEPSGKIYICDFPSCEFISCHLKYSVVLMVTPSCRR